MLLGRRHVALDVVGDVVHVEQQMVFGEMVARPVHQRDVLDQGHHMARAGFAHGVVQAGKGTDVNHFNPQTFTSAANRFRYRASASLADHGVR